MKYQYIPHTKYKLTVILNCNAIPLVSLVRLVLAGMKMKLMINLVLNSEGIIRVLGALVHPPGT